MSETESDLVRLRELARLLDETGLTEIEIEADGKRVRLARQPAPITTMSGFVAAAGPAPATGATYAAPAAAADTAPHPGAVASPMVGTVYVAAEPGAAPFVQVGDTVTEGQTVLIVEAMKTMNPIPAPRSGRITRILVSDAQPVEFGEPLLVIE